MPFVQRAARYQYFFSQRLHFFYRYGPILYSMNLMSQSSKHLQMNPTLSYPFCLHNINEGSDRINEKHFQCVMEYIQRKINIFHKCNLLMNI